MHSHQPSNLEEAERHAETQDAKNQKNKSTFACLVLGIHVLDEVKNTGGVTSLVVVPRNKLDEVVGQSNTGLLVKDRRVRIGNEITAHNVVIVVSEDALHLALGGLLDGGADGLVRGTLVQTAGKVNDGNVGGGDTERHTGELAVQLGDDLADGLGGAGRRGDDVVASGAATTPVLLGGTVDGLLGGGDGVDGGHETLLEAELVVDDLGERGKAVGSARSVGDNVHGGLVLLLVDAHDEHGSIARGGGDDDLLGATGHVLGGTLGGGKDTSGLNDVVGTGRSPLDLGGVHLVEDLDGLAIDGDLIVTVLGNDAGELTVDGIVLEHVLHVVGGDEGIVDGNDVDHGVVLSGAHDEAADTAETVDANVDGLERVLGAVAVDNVGELGLEGCTTNEEAINVGLGGKTTGSGSGSGSTVKDAGGLGNAGAGDLTEVLTDVGVGVLGLLGGGGKTGANGPDGLVC